MKARKIPALLVALCMLISLLPAVPVTTAEAAEPTQTISFPIADGATYLGGSITLDTHSWAANSAETHVNVISYMNNDTNYTKVTSSDARFRLYYPGEYFALDFKVNKSGYYDIALELGDYDNYKMQVSTVIDGTAMNSFTCPGDGYGVGNNDIASLGAKYLTAGVHTLIVKMVDFVGTAAEKMIFLKSIQLTERDDMPDPKDQTVTFGHKGQKNGYGNLYNYAGIVTVNNNPTRRVSIANSGWEIDKANTNIDFYNNMDKGENVLNANHSKVDANASWYIGYKFVVDASGYYDLSAKILQGTIGANATATIDGADIGTLTGNKADDSYPAAVLPLRKGVYLTAGEHVLKLTFTTSGRFWLYDLYLTAGGPVAETKNLYFDSNRSGITGDTVTSAKLDDGAMWELGENNTVNLSSGAIYEKNINAKLYENAVLEFAFEVPVAGDYELFLELGEYCDYAANAEVSVNGTVAGRVYNDNNVVKDLETVKKGVGVVSLNAGKNTLSFKGLLSDIVDIAGDASGKNQMGDIQLYLYSASFVPVEDGASCVTGIKVNYTDRVLEVGDNNTISAQVLVNGVVDASKTVTVKPMNTNIISCENGTITAKAAGTGLIELEYVENGVLYEEQVRVKVKDSNSPIFGTSYAYVREDASGSYTISLIGALDSIAFKAAGFEVWSNEERLADESTTQVYKTVTTKDGVKNPTDYGSTDDGYIFFSTVSGVKANNTYIVKPYVIDENNNKIYHNDLTLVIQ